MCDRELRDIDPTDVAEGPSKSTVSQPNNEIQSSTRREENPFTNRALPPLPRLAAENTVPHCAEVENQYIEDAEIPYYVEFLEYVDRPIMLEAHVHEPPRPSLNPSLSTAQTYHTIQECAEHPLTSNLHVPGSNHSSNLSDIDHSAYNSTRQEKEESIYCDNLSYFPDTDSEVSESLYDFHSSYLTDVSEPLQTQHPQQQQQQHQQQQRHKHRQQQQQQWTENEQFLFYTIICFLTLSVLHFLQAQC